MTDIIVRQDGSIGRITLNRPEALNAITDAMVTDMAEALAAWKDDPQISCVVIDGAGERAFCAGGDILSIYQNGKSNPEVVQGFWRREYALNLMIETYPKPYVAIMDGFTMGGGVGVSAHGSHRLVTERSIVSMPETAIGFLPDVGGTWLLSRAPGKTGLYAGLTAARLNAADAIYAGFADAFIESERAEELTARLRDGENVDTVISDIKKAPPKVSNLKMNREEIDELFASDSLLECVDMIWNSDSEFAQETFKALRKHSPFAIAGTFYAVQQAREFSSLKECLVHEYAYAHRCLEGHDLYEGIRAAVVDKDRNPQWKPASLEEVNIKDVEAMFDSLGDQALVI